MRWNAGTSVIPVFLLACLGTSIRATPPPGADQGLRVGTRPFAANLAAYASVEPVALVTVPALAEGTLASWKVFPGMAVAKGERLGRLVGPERAKEVAEAQAALEQAKEALALAEQDEATVQQTYPVLTNRQGLAKARTAVDQARSALHAAQARWAFVSEAGELRAPVSGTVTDVEAANGQAVMPSMVLCRLEDPSHLWVHATFYGSDALALKPGMAGTFAPPGGGAPIPVRLRSIIAPLRPDGGRSVGCQAIGSPSWLSGEAGVLRLTGASTKWPAVPERALVLKGRRWYVLVAEGSGTQAREVEPGPKMGGWRAIEKGLKAGERVVVDDVYLQFHRDVAKSYIPPD